MTRTARPRLSARSRGLAAAGLLAALAVPLRPCTVAVCSGRATADGRPLLWKNRDSSFVHNRVLALAGPKYAFFAVVNAEDAAGREAWSGMNEAGFAVMNAQTDDQAGPKTPGDANGAFMRRALGECRTVAEFEALLARSRGEDLATTFGAIDAAGGASLFETSSRGYVRFDASDPRVAPFGYLVRTNFAFTSPDPLLGGGFIRFERAAHLFERARAENRLDARFILREAARDLVHEKLQSFPLERALPADPAAPFYVHTNDTISRNSTVSVSVFRGAPSPDRPDLATMWVLLGQPVAGVAVPLWPATKTVPAAVSGEKTAPLSDFARALVAELYPDRRGRMPQYLDVRRLRTYGGDGVLARLFRIEDGIMDEAAAALARWEKEPPAPGAAAALQSSLAAHALESLRASFPDLR